MKNPSRQLLALGLCCAMLLAAACGSDSDSTTYPNSDAGTASDASTASDTSNASDATSSTGEPPGMEGMTQAHNSARASVDPPASPALPAMQWANDVAQQAQAYAERCSFEHSGTKGLGENIYASSNAVTPAKVVESWVSEKQNYTYATNSCTKVCGHYTQVVWRDSTKLGCGHASCKTNSPFGSGNWEFWVCNYQPPGNYVGQKPY